MIKRFRQTKKLTFLLKTGFFHIFSSQMINIIFQFAISIVLIRLLPKEELGSWLYAFNILSFFLLLQGIGIVPGILQYSSAAKDEEDRLSFFKYGLRIGIIFNFFICISIFTFTLLFSLPVKGSSRVLQFLCMIPIFTILFEAIQIYLRASFKNKKYSILSTINTVSLFIGATIGADLLRTNGVVLGRYIAYSICIVFGVIFLKKEFYKLKEVKLPDLFKRKEFLKYSIVSAFNNSISSLVYIIDTFMIGLIIKDELVVASYKTATLVPFGLNFIPMSIMIFAYPYFAKMSTENEKLKYYFYLLQKYLFILNGLISIVLIIFAPQIIRIMFGIEYMDSVTAFRILSFGYFIAGTFRIPAGNVLASIKKIKVNFVLTLISGILNIILNIILVPFYSSTGAAFATISVFIISSIIANGYLFLYFRKNSYKYIPQGS